MKSITRLLAVSLVVGQFTASVGYGQAPTDPNSVFVNEAEAVAVTLIPSEQGKSTILLTALDDFDDAMVFGDGVTGEPLWTARIGAIFLNRGGPRGTLLAFNEGGDAVLKSGQFDFSIPWGMEIDVIRHRINGSAWGLEGRYFGVSDFNASTSTLLDTDAYLPYINPIGAPYAPTNLDAKYQTSNLLNFELNARHQVNQDLQLLVGFRHVRFSEDMSIHLASDPFSYFSDHQIGARNNLYGAQLGADARLWQQGRFRLEGLAKAGLFGNQSSNSVFVLLQDEVPAVYASSASQTQAAFLGELGLTGLYRITDYVAFRATYQAFWLEGVALASDQIASSDPVTGAGAVNNNGGVVFYGAFLGLEFTR